jgi:hypothetical protein
LEVYVSFELCRQAPGKSGDLQDLGTDYKYTLIYDIKYHALRMKICDAGLSDISAVQALCIFSSRTVLASFH